MVGKKPVLKLADGDKTWAGKNPCKRAANWECERCWSVCRQWKDLTYSVSVNGETNWFKEICEPCAVELGLKW